MSVKIKTRRTGLICAVAGNCSARKAPTSRTIIVATRRLKPYPQAVPHRAREDSSMMRAPQESVREPLTGKRLQEKMSGKYITRLMDETRS